MFTEQVNLCSLNKKILDFWCSLNNPHTDAQYQRMVVYCHFHVVLGLLALFWLVMYVSLGLHVDFLIPATQTTTYNRGQLAEN